MQNHYEINVAERHQHDRSEQGWYLRHLFATAERSVTSQQQLENLLPMILKAFPQPHFEVSVTHWKAAGERVTHVAPGEVVYGSAADTVDQVTWADGRGQMPRPRPRSGPPRGSPGAPRGRARRGSV